MTPGADPIPAEEEEITPQFNLWVDEDKRICLVISHPSIIEFEGSLAPGAACSIQGAIRLAKEILERVEAATTKEEE